MKRVGHDRPVKPIPAHLYLAAILLVLAALFLVALLNGLGADRPVSR